MHMRPRVACAPLTDASVRPEVAALFFAGVDTTSHTIVFALCALLAAAAGACPPAASPALIVAQGCMLQCMLQCKQDAVQHATPGIHDSWQRSRQDAVHTCVLPLQVLEPQSEEAQRPARPDAVQ